MITFYFPQWAITFPISTCSLQCDLEVPPQSRGKGSSSPFQESLGLTCLTFEVRLEKVKVRLLPRLLDRRSEVIMLGKGSGCREASMDAMKRKPCAHRPLGDGPTLHLTTVRMQPSELLLVRTTCQFLPDACSIEPSTDG